MTNATKAPNDADYAKYDRVWQRVAPKMCGGAAETETGGADCCMGEGSAGMAPEIEGYIADELADAAFYSAFAGRARTQAGRAAMASFAADERGHAKRLMAAYYLITGKYCSPAPSPAQPLPTWRDGLAGRFRAEACGGRDYAASAAETDDPCLKKLLGGMSADEYAHAERLLSLLAATF
jgi:rubrerythrin